MTSSVKTKIDDLLKFWNTKRSEFVKTICNPERSQNVDIFSLYTLYGTDSNCDSKFGFSLPSERCIGCTELSLLTKSGEFNHEDLDISNSEMKRYSIRASKYALQSYILNYTKNKTLNFLRNFKCLSFFTFPKSKKIIICKIENIHAHEITIASLIEKKIYIVSNFFWSYSCKNLVIINKVRNRSRVLSEGDYRKELIFYIFKKLKNLSENYFIHGRESLEYIEIISNDKRDYSIILTPCEKSSFLTIASDQKNIILFTSTSFSQSENSTIPLSFKYLENTTELTFDIPMIEEYSRMITPVIKMSEEIFLYYDEKCLNVFQPFRLYIWILVFMCNRKFFEIIPRDFLELFFFEDEIEHVIMHVVEFHSQPIVSYEEIKNLAITANISMKINLMNLLTDYLI